MNAALPLLLASVLGAGGSLDVGMRGEGSVRRVEPATTAADARRVDLTLAPHAVLLLDGGGSTAELAYRPLLAARDLGPDRRLEAYHEGELRLRRESGSRWRLELFGVGAFGQTDLLSLGRRAPPGEDAGTVSTTSSLEVRTLRAGASLRLAASNRTEWVLSASGSAGGGADASSRFFLPTERTVEGEVQVGWSATRRDRLVVSLAAAGSRLPDMDGDSAWSTALATWRHRASPRLELSLGAGAVGFFSSFPRAGEDRMVSRNVRPASVAGLTASADENALSVNVEVRLGATNDRVTGLASQSLDGSALLGWAATRRLALRVSGSGSVSWPESGPTRRAGVETGATLRLSRRVFLDAGGYGTWQRSESSFAPTLTEYGALVAVSVGAPALRW